MSDFIIAAFFASQMICCSLKRHRISNQQHSLFVCAVMNGSQTPCGVAFCLEPAETIKSKYTEEKWTVLNNRGHQD